VLHAMAATPITARAGGQSALVTWAGLRRAACNLGLALLFFASLVPHYGSGLANWIWIAGAVLMGLLMLVRLPAIAATITPSVLLATAASIILPLMMRPGIASRGPMAVAAIVVELIGVIAGQGSRLYLGRRFAILPANRGVVTGGPFRFVRHPIYLGWLILSIGYVMAYPSPRNSVVVIITLPAIVWRILQEEALLAAEPEYREYLTRTRWRLIPFIY
jgi:protein-S-isoprenylcysteine O-methyltransferase Ste14